MQSMYARGGEPSLAALRRHLCCAGRLTDHLGVELIWLLEGRKDRDCSAGWCGGHFRRGLRSLDAAPG